MEVLYQVIPVEDFSPLVVSAHLCNEIPHSIMPIA